MSVNKKLTKVLVVCHDAGGAEVVSSYVKYNLIDKQYICIVKGPAVKVFERKGLHFLVKRGGPKTAKSFFDKTKEVFDLVLTGSSSPSTLELDYTREAKRKDIKTITLLDHWVNYKERFKYPKKNWKENLPDEIWLGDKYGYDMAKACFPGLPVKLVPNMFFKEIKDEYDKAKKKYAKRNNILFVGEPISKSLNYNSKLCTEYDILDIFLRYCVDNSIKNKILVRRHPSEKAGKYGIIINKYEKVLLVSESSEPSMFVELAKSSLVIGMRSMFLVLAVLCNKKTVSFLPGKWPECPIPFKQIKKIRNINQIKI